LAIIGQILKLHKLINFANQIQYIVINEGFTSGSNSCNLLYNL